MALRDVADGRDVASSLADRLALVLGLDLDDGPDLDLGHGLAGGVHLAGHGDGERLHADRGDVERLEQVADEDLLVLVPLDELDVLLQQVAHHLEVLRLLAEGLAEVALLGDEDDALALVDGVLDAGAQALLGLRDEADGLHAEVEVCHQDTGEGGGPGRFQVGKGGLGYGRIGSPSPPGPREAACGAQQGAPLRYLPSCRTSDVPASSTASAEMANGLP